MNQTDIELLYRRLCTPPGDADKGWYQSRGYHFERLLNALLERDNLSPRTSYKPRGEQIDGSFFFDGRVFLLEAKWHSEPAPASTIYQFKGKVEGKLVGTLGIFVSMAGYTNECVDALVLGKSLNVLLLGQDDIEVALSMPGAFADLLRLRLREAAETGSVYRSASPEDLHAAPYTRPPLEEEMPLPEEAQEAESGGKIAIVCEGRFDAFILHDLAFRILKENGLEAEIKVVHAGGKQNLPRVANLFAPAAESTTVILVVDTDGDVETTRRLVHEGVSYDRFNLVTPDQSIEAWLLGGDKAAAATTRARQLTERVRRSTSKTEEQLDSTDIRKLRSADAEFASFYEIVRNAGKAPNKADTGDA